MLQPEFGVRRRGAVLFFAQSPLETPANHHVAPWRGGQMYLNDVKFVASSDVGSIPVGVARLTQIRPSPHIPCQLRFRYSPLLDLRVLPSDRDRRAERRNSQLTTTVETLVMAAVSDCIDALPTESTVTNQIPSPSSPEYPGSEPGRLGPRDRGQNSQLITHGHRRIDGFQIDYVRPREFRDPLFRLITANRPGVRRGSAQAQSRERPNIRPNRS